MHTKWAVAKVRRIAKAKILNISDEGYGIVAALRHRGTSAQLSDTPKDVSSTVALRSTKASSYHADLAQDFRAGD